MKKLFSVVEAVYTPKPEEVEVEKVETLAEHVETDVPTTPIVEYKLNVLVNDISIAEKCRIIGCSVEELNEMKIAVNKEDFKALFGPKSKPRKGDVLSIAGLQKKFKVKKSKKFSARKKGKGYKITLKSE
jgi:hypothetical protein